MQATWMKCIASTMPLDEQACDRVAQSVASCTIVQPAPPDPAGTLADITRASRSAASVSCGKRACASTSAACLAATSVAIERTLLSNLSNSWLCMPWASG